MKCLGSRDLSSETGQLASELDVRSARNAIESTYNRTLAGIVTRRVCDRNHRIEEWQTRWDEVRDALEAILIERGGQLSVPDETSAVVAGGSTGFIVKDHKGKDGNVPVYRIDPGVSQLLRDLLEVGKRVAEEMGQWAEKREHFVSDAERAFKPDPSKLTTEELHTLIELLKKSRPSPDSDPDR
jgi:hypothetical protein